MKLSPIGKKQAILLESEFYSTFRGFVVFYITYPILVLLLVSRLHKLDEIDLSPKLFDCHAVQVESGTENALLIRLRVGMVFHSDHADA